MAKPKENKGQVGGISQDKVLHITRTINEAVANAKDYTDSANESVKAFGEDGGNAAAVRFVARLLRMDSLKAQTLLNDINTYADMAGIFDQGDFFDSANAEDTAAAGVH